MNPQALDELPSRNPFVPLRFTLTTEETLDLTDPGTVFINNLALCVYNVKRQGSHIADWSRFISLRHIVKVEQIETSSAA